VKNFIDAFLSRDIGNIQPLIAKNYVFQTFPKSAEPSGETQEAQMQRHGKILAQITKLEVRTTPENCLRAHRLTSTTSSPIFTK
jgi:hypothetical protein